MTRFSYDRKRPRLEVWRERYTIDPATGCWVWQAGKQSKGYGIFAADGKCGLLAHRWGWEQLRGPVPEGLQLDHLCRNRACVNPDHLEVVTQSTNIIRALPFSSRIDPPFCPKGHEYTEENTYRAPKAPATKNCRTCKAEGDQRRLEERRIARGWPAEGLPPNVCRNGHQDERNDVGTCKACAREATARWRRKRAGG